MSCKEIDYDYKEDTEDEAGALQNQIDLLTHRLAKVKDADDKHDFESIRADGGETLQDTPRREICVETAALEQNLPR